MGRCSFIHALSSRGVRPEEKYGAVVLKGEIDRTNSCFGGCHLFSIHRSVSSLGATGTAILLKDSVAACSGRTRLLIPNKS